ncbi:hypothetical protein ETU10_00160, partial [Apibacter muscae]|uniref:delta-60 repeat domain-containing protein n=1 Tax=Apibacter muscae TaxID=2509004 RepID=UPI0011ADD041
MKKKFTLFVCIFLYSLLQAQQYEVDTNYGTQGMALHQLKGDKQFATDYVQLHNGKILISGTTGVIRINEDYTQDFSFGKKGRIRVPLDRIFERADHKIIGIKKSINSNLLTVHCFLADGSYDRSFGNQGTLEVDLEDNDSIDFSNNSLGMAIQGDQLLLALYSGKVIRLTSNGNLDTTFGNQGVINIPLPKKVEEIVSSNDDIRLVVDIIVGPDGRLIFATNVFPKQGLSENHIAYILKYSSEGILETTFGENEDGCYIIKYLNGSITYPLTARLHKIQMSHNGTILALTEVQSNDSNYEPSMIFSKISYDGKNKLNENVLHSGFTNPSYPPTIGSSTLVYKNILELSENNYVVTAYCNSSQAPKKFYYDQGALALLKPDGTFDANFGNNGAFYITDSKTGFASNAIGTLELKDGSLLTIGSYLLYSFSGEENYGITLYKFDQRGNPILTFGKGGKMIYSIPSEKQSIFTMGVQPDNKLLLGSSTIWRLLENGSFDSEFNPIKNEYSVSGTGGADYYFNGFLKINSMDGSIKTVGTYINSYTNNGLLLNSTPSMDRGSNHSDVLAIQPDGKYIFMRNKYSSNGVGAPAEQNIYRNNPDGTLDNTFTFDKEFSIYSSDANQIQSIALQGDQLLVGGNFILVGPPNPMQTQKSIRRFNSDGSYDYTFTPLKARPIKVQSDKKIILKDGTYLERYLPDGDPDLSYGTNGKVDLNSILEISTFTYQILPDDKVLIHAKTTQGENQLLQLTPEGKLDINFANQGIYIIDPSLDAQIVQVQSDDKILIGGTKTLDGEEYMAVLRLKKQENQQQTKKNQSI